MFSSLNQNIYSQKPPYPYITSRWLPLPIKPIWAQNRMSGKSILLWRSKIYGSVRSQQAKMVKTWSTCKLLKLESFPQCPCVVNMELDGKHKTAPGKFKIKIQMQDILAISHVAYLYFRYARRQYFSFIFLA